jgi:hypothetical protein
MLLSLFIHPGQAGCPRPKARRFANFVICYNQFDTLYNQAAAGKPT